MRINPWRPYRPATCSGKRTRPVALQKRQHEPFWTKIKRRLLARKAKQRSAREKRGYALWSR